MECALISIRQGTHLSLTQTWHSMTCVSLTSFMIAYPSAGEWSWAAEDEDLGGPFSYVTRIMPDGAGNPGTA